MIKKQLFLGTVLGISSPVYSMQPLVMQALTIMRYGAMAWRPWKKAAERIVHSWRDDEGIQRNINNKYWQYADPEITTYIQNLVGDSTVRIILTPKTQSSEDYASTLWAYRNVYSGKKIIFIDSRYIDVLLGNNNALYVSDYEHAMKKMVESSYALYKQQTSQSDAEFKKILHNLRNKLVEFSIKTSLKTELDALIIHEYGHLYNFDSRRKILAYTGTPIIPLLIDSIGTKLVSAGSLYITNPLTKIAGSLLLSSIASYIYFKATPYILAMIDRTIERQADMHIIRNKNTEIVKGGAIAFYKNVVLEHYMLQDLSKPFLDSHPRSEARMRLCTKEVDRRKAEL